MRKTLNRTRGFASPGVFGLETLNGLVVQFTTA
jgi:hypothetical protein